MRCRSGIFYGLLSVVAVFSLMGSRPVAAAEDSNTQQDTKIVRASYFDSGNGFFTESTDGEPKSGYAYEYMQLLANYNNWEYEYVYGPWSDHYQMLMAGEIDLMFDVSYTEERAEYMYFSDQPMGTEHFYIYTNSNLDAGIEKGDYSTLNGKKIGIVTDTVQVDMLKNWLSQHSIQCEIVEYSGESDRLADFDSGKIDAQVTLDTYVRDNWLPIVEIGSSDYYFAVSKNRPDLIEELNRAQEQILEGDLYFNETLQKKYFSGAVTQKELETKEQAWLTSHGTIRVGYLEGYFPYCGTDTESGKLQGALSVLLERLKKEYDMNFSYTAYTSTQDMKKALQDGEIDVMFPVRGSMWVADGEDFMLTNSLVTGQAVLLYTGNYDADKIKRVAAYSSMQFSKRYIEEVCPGAEILWTDDGEDCITAVSEQEGTCILTDNYTYLYFKSLYSDVNRLQVAVLTNPAEIHLAVSRDAMELLSILNKGINLIDDKEINDALITWSKAEGVYTFEDFLRDNAPAIFFVILLVFALIIGVFGVYFAALDQNRKKLLAANHEAEEARKHAEEANRAKSTFLNNMSHDIRTPMNAVIGFTELASLYVEDTEQVRDYLNKIMVSGNYLLSIINDVLDMSMIESGQVQIKPEPCSLKEIMNELEVVTMGQAKEKDIALSIDMSGVRNVDVFCDKLRVKQILQNLIGNAVKFTNPGGYVKLTVTQQEEVAAGRGAAYEFRIKDNGIGMSLEFQKHIFEMFARERTSTDSGQQGTGLGLSITKKLVDMMSGTITMSSEEDRGTEFIIRLEFALQDRFQNAYIPARTAETKANDDRELLQAFSSHSHVKKILLVEDNALNREIAEEILGENGFQVKNAENGAVAVDMVRRSRPGDMDVILMDIQMPVMDGYEATKTIRSLSNQKLANIPIIAMTANAFDQDRQKAEECGMDGYVAKPIEVEKLLEELGKI